MGFRVAVAVEGEQRKGVVAHTNDTTGFTPSAASALWGLAGGSGGPVETGMHASSAVAMRPS
jgi:hypothetical protein